MKLRHAWTSDPHPLTNHEKINVLFTATKFVCCAKTNTYVLHFKLILYVMSSKGQDSPFPYRMSNCSSIICVKTE